MKLDKLLPHYIKAYIIDLPCIIFHELCHYIVAVIIWCLGLAPSFPTMQITRWFRLEYKDDCNFTAYNWCASVTNHYYTTSLSIFANILITIAPAIGCILLFIFSPWYIYPFYIANINWLWLSADDAQQICDYFKSKRHE